MPISRWPETLDFPANLDWRSLDKELLYEILSLPNEVCTASNDVKFIIEVASTEQDPQYLNTVNKQYTPLGLKADRGGMMRLGIGLARIMPSQAFCNIVRAARVIFVGKFQTLQDIDVLHVAPVRLR